MLPSFLRKNSEYSVFLALYRKERDTACTKNCSCLELCYLLDYSGFNLFYFFSNRSDKQSINNRYIIACFY